ncbi:hypothetical protein Ccrd_007991 [Cynara cardunculus var. scolymus]|uniref:Uncharacterized protein n=1 Tax=Cynara cardunculus var. scolymus TaxID=59895 RepID=A0A118JTN9_CYNCS|nr:hypothetical protein Ccrd_007991 [Cynara cardunculus var. scolymus]
MTISLLCPRDHLLSRLTFSKDSSFDSRSLTFDSYPSFSSIVFSRSFDLLSSSSFRLSLRIKSSEISRSLRDLSICFQVLPSDFDSGLFSKDSIFNSRSLTFDSKLSFSSKLRVSTLRTSSPFLVLCLKQPDILNPVLPFLLLQQPIFLSTRQYLYPMLQRYGCLDMNA